MSAECSGTEDSKDGWDGLGHQVSIVRPPTQQFLSSTPLFSRQHDLSPKPEKNQPLIATCNVRKEDRDRQGRTVYRKSSALARFFPLISSGARPAIADGDDAVFVDSLAK